MANAAPTLFEWMGGMPMIERMLETFYRRVPQDPLMPHWGWGEVKGPYVK